MLTQVHNNLNNDKFHEDTRGAGACNPADARGLWPVPGCSLGYRVRPSPRPSKKKKKGRRTLRRVGDAQQEMVRE